MPTDIRRPRRGSGGTLHPCAGHACDHCATCDVRGICCASIKAPVAATVTATSDTGSLANLRSALAEDNKAGRTSRKGLRELIISPSPPTQTPVSITVPGLRTPLSRPALSPPSTDLTLQSLRNIGDSQCSEQVPCCEH
ncbi:MAG TPA: hypothetical protein VNA57_00095 [Acidimicrobiales bacterium]|nr:hypothetical protein [Acidimicrobiales bacterium]